MPLNPIKIHIIELIGPLLTAPNAAFLAATN